LILSPRSSTPLTIVHCGEPTLDVAVGSNSGSPFLFSDPQYWCMLCAVLSIGLTLASQLRTSKAVPCLKLTDLGAT